MIETVLAVLIITGIFLTLFKLSHLLTGHILLQHSAMRAARARAVGYNDFQCAKVARLSVIPVAGRRITPLGEANELLIANKYLQTPSGGHARSLLHYEGWDDFSIAFPEPGMATTRLKTDWFDLGGQAEINFDYQLYLNDQGL